MPVTQHYAATYAEARQKFRDAATKAGAALARYSNPAKGPAGEELTTDVARLGPAGAANVLMTVSATHGAEGFCGSGIQIASFAAGFGRTLPKDTALFVDHGKPLPRNEGYEELVDAICPLEWSEAGLLAAQKTLDAFAMKHGMAALQKAVSGGQY